jgi:hypothetical protein
VRVVAWGDLTWQPITSELAEQALEDLLPQAEAEIPPDLILEESARYFGLSVQDLISPNRSRPLTSLHVAIPDAEERRSDQDRRPDRRDHDGPPRIEGEKDMSADLLLVGSSA